MFIWFSGMAAPLVDSVSIPIFTNAGRNVILTYKSLDGSADSGSVGAMTTRYQRLIFTQAKDKRMSFKDAF
jgi:hypothetical protein